MLPVSLRRSWKALHPKQIWLNPSYGWFLLGQSVSRLGDSLHWIALATLAYRAAHSALALSGLWLSFSLPVILAGPLIGTLLDRHLPLRTTLITADLLRATLIIIISLLPFSYTTFIPLYLVITLAEVAFDSARGILVPNLVPEAQLLKANGTMGSVSSAIALIGPALAGLMVAYLSVQFVLVIDALTFVVSAIAITRIPPECFQRERATAEEESSHSQKEETFWRSLLGGVKAIVTSPILLGFGLFFLLMDLAQGASNIMLLPFVEQYFDTSLFGFLISAFALGRLIGNLVTRRLPNHVMLAAFGISCVLAGLARVLFGLANHVPILVVGAILSTSAAAVTGVITNTTLQRTVPKSLRGRVFSTIDSLREAAFLLSTSAAGLIAGLVSVRAFFVLNGIVMAAGVLLVSIRAIGSQMALAHRQATGD